MIISESNVFYFLNVYNQEGNLVFMGTDEESGQIALYTLDSENTFNKVPSIGGGGSQSIEYIAIDDLTSDNSSVTVEGISFTISECYNRGVLPCIVANHGALFYPSYWMGDRSPVSTQIIQEYVFYYTNDYGIDKISVIGDKCTLTQIQFQTIGE